MIVMEILSIKLKNNRTSTIFLISTDCGEFRMHSDVIVKYSVHIGQMSDDKFFSALSESEILIAFNLVSKYLNSRMKSEREIRDYLRKKDFSPPTIKGVIEKLREYKIIDDETYADTFIRTRQNESKQKIKQKLISKGIKADIIDEHLRDVDDFDACLNSAKKYMKNKVIDRSTIEKLYRHLISKGYTYDVVRRAVSMATSEDIEDLE